MTVDDLHMIIAMILIGIISAVSVWSALQRGYRKPEKGSVPA